MLDRLLRAFLVIGGVSAACAWTWPGAFPEADPLAVLVRYHTPNSYTAVVAWYYLTPAVAVLLTGQLLLSTSRIWFARMGVGMGLRARLPRWPHSPTADVPAIVVGEVHHPSKPLSARLRTGSRFRSVDSIPAWRFSARSGPARRRPVCTRSRASS